MRNDELYNTSKYLNQQRGWPSPKECACQQRVRCKRILVWYVKSNENGWTQTFALHRPHQCTGYNQCRSLLVLCLPALACPGGTSPTSLADLTPNIMQTSRDATLTQHAARDITLTTDMFEVPAHICGQNHRNYSLPGFCPS